MNRLFRLSVFVAILGAMVPGLASARPSCPGHPSCGDGGGDGGDGGDGGSGQFDPTACQGATGNFPAMAFNREVHAKNGNLSATQILLTNSDGSCEVLVYEGNGFAGESPSFHFDPVSETGTLVWFQTEGKRSRSDVLTRATFNVDTQNKIVDTPLPLTAESIWSTPSGAGFGVGIDIGLSPDGSRVAFPYEQSFSAGDGTEIAQVLVCDLALWCSQGPVVAFEAVNTDTSTGLGGTRQLAWGKGGPGTDRLYFLFGYDEPVFRGDLVAIDEVSTGVWTQPTVILDNADDGSASEPYRALWEPESMSLTQVGADCVALTSSLDGAGTNRIEILQIPQDLSGAPYDPMVLDASKVSGQQASWRDQSASSCLDATLWLSEGVNDSGLYIVDPQAASQAPLGFTGKAVDSAL